MNARSTHRNLVRDRPVWILIAACVSVPAAAGALLALIFFPASPTAEARLIVGTQELSAQQVPFYTNSTVSLAETYARYITDGGIEGVDTGIELRATAVPETPLLRIEATADSAEAAMNGAQEAAEQLIERVNASAQRDQTDELQTQYLQASGNVAELKARVETLSTEGSTEESAVQLNSDLRLAELRVEALGEAYRQAYTTDVAPATDLRQVQEARTVTQTLPQPLLFGVLAGGLLGSLGVLVVASLPEPPGPRRAGK